MDRNLKILMIFLILMFIYDLFCRKNIEGFTKKNFVYYSEGLPGPNYTPNRTPNPSVNSFTYENVSGTDEIKAKHGFDNIYPDFLKKYAIGNSLKLDDINSTSDPFFYQYVMNDSDTEDSCQIQYPKWNDDIKIYDTGLLDENGSKVNLYKQCIKDGLPFKKSLCLLPDRGNPRGTINGSNVYKPYYMWDVFPNKSDGGMCTYTPPSVLITGQYCSAHTDKDECENASTNDGKKHCNWIPSFRSDPYPTMDHAILCNSKNTGEGNSADKNECENASIDGFRPCKFTENTIFIKASDEDGKQSGSIDVHGTCEIDFNNYVGGLNLDEIRFYSADGDISVNKSSNGSLIVSVDSVDDKSKLYRYINSGKCMENCSVSSSSVCNNRFSCVWVDDIKPAKIDPDLGNRLKGPELEGKCLNKELYFNMKDNDDPTKLAEIYDHKNICNHHKTEQTCNSGSDSPDAPSRLTDDSWHCKWKHYLGMCDQIGVKQIVDPNDADKVSSVEFTSQDGNYITKQDALSCQTLLANHVISKMNPDDAQNPIKQFEYMADPANADDLKKFCNEYRYDSASLSASDGYDNASNTPGAQFCLWKPPREPECGYKGGPDLVNPGEYFNKNNQPFGQFTYQEPAFYYNNNFPPMCSLLNKGDKVTKADCERASRNCSWVGTEENGSCNPRCIRVGSNNNICGKTVDEQYNQAVAHNKTSRVPDPMLSSTDPDTIIEVKKRFDDYSHCKFNEELNTCVLNKDYENWKNGGPWSSEIETQKWT
tara:strand:+ start:2494 stop:4785 length:2292 start_codon:yes stop_codon:yes gene_type:complete